MKSLILAAGIGAVTFGSAMAGAQVTYQLNGGSTHASTCALPCICPIVTLTGMTGEFSLRFVTSDPIYDRYDVDAVVLQTGGPQPRTFTGTGTYLIGGDVGLVQRLTLNLTRDDGVETDFDSGIVPVLAGFPNIRITATSASIESCFFDQVVIESSVHCSADFDGDGDTGTDFDIEAFFRCLGGLCCFTCGSADFDGDGDVGTDADIEAFFRVLGGGAC